VKTAFTASFEKDLRRIADRRVRASVSEAISEVEAARRPGEIRGLKKLRAGGDYFRLRIGDYRVGLTIEDEVVKFVRLLHRSEIYRYFP
jgi:mRNA interferase RelE/StbE